jgi:LysM repeat protein
MENRPPTNEVIANFRKRRQQSSNLLFFYGLIVLLVISGVILIIFSLSGGGNPLASVFQTKTPTPTITDTPTLTPPPTDTPTITLTPTVSATATASAPFTYTVQEGDTLDSIATKFNLGKDGIPLLLQINPSIDPTTQIIHVGDQILVPNPGLQLFTPTPIPANLRPGTKVPYTVQSGDTLAGIASKFNSTVDAIVTANNLKDANSIQVGQLLQIPVNLVTPTPTHPPTLPPHPTATVAATPTP